jgi:hypothetical protein
MVLLGHLPLLALVAAAGRRQRSPPRASSGPCRPAGGTDAGAQADHLAASTHGLLLAIVLVLPWSRRRLSLAAGVKR